MQILFKKLVTLSVGVGLCLGPMVVCITCMPGETTHPRSVFAAANYDPALCHDTRFTGMSVV